MHAADLARAIRLTIESGERLGESGSRGLYYVDAAEFLSFNELAQMIGRIFNRDNICVIQSPRWMTWAVGLFCEMAGQILRRPFVMNLDKAREANAGSWSCDASAIGKLGFAADPIWNRLRQTAEWYTRQGWLKDSSASRRDPHGTGSHVAAGAKRNEG